MNGLLLHPDTEARIAAYIGHPAHAMLLLAPPGAGKFSVALYIASELLGVVPVKLQNYPYFRVFAPANGKTISVDDIREVAHFLALRTPYNNRIGRVVIIEQAQLMTQQAQNALLKTIEEPPEGTVLILTARSELGLLPTIRSRVQVMQLQQAGREATVDFFARTYDMPAIQKALMVSDGLPGLTQALLENDSEHPLAAATSSARDILQKTAFERLAMVDSLAKDKQLCLDTLFILARMSDVSLRNTGASEAASRRWLRILAACNEAQAQILGSAQLKLVLLNFMLAV